MIKKILLSVSLLVAVSACAGGEDNVSTGNDLADGSASTNPSDVNVTTYGTDLSQINEKQGAFDAAVGANVYFGYDSHALDEDAKATLRKQAEWLKTNAGIDLIIEGHTDERGTREYNLALGARRATATKDFLVASGVPAGSITTISFGKERPAVAGFDESAWSKNRRSITVLKK
ncbi:MAG: peptidoglycan-associated lipoprotein Pal [Alphaproteobacteria bacterium]